MTTTHDHAIETLPDGRRVCFECDVDAATIARVLRHLGSDIILTDDEAQIALGLY